MDGDSLSTGGNNICVLTADLCGFAICSPTGAVHGQILDYTSVSRAQGLCLGVMTAVIMIIMVFVRTRTILAGVSSSVTFVVNPAFVDCVLVSLTHATGLWVQGHVYVYQTVHVRQVNESFELLPCILSCQALTNTILIYSARFMIIRRENLCLPRRDEYLGEQVQSIFQTTTLSFCSGFPDEMPG